MVTRYVMSPCAGCDDCGSECDAEMDPHPVGDYVCWADYQKLLNAYTDLAISIKIIVEELYDGRDFS